MLKIVETRDGTITYYGGRTVVGPDAESCGELLGLDLGFSELIPEGAVITVVMDDKVTVGINNTVFATGTDLKETVDGALVRFKESMGRANREPHWFTRLLLGIVQWLSFGFAGKAESETGNNMRSSR